MAPVYEFADSYGAGELVKSAYESALSGDSTAWETALNWLRTEMLYPVRAVGDAAASSVVPVLILAVLRGCMTDTNGGSVGARFLLRMMLLLGFSDLAGLSISAVDTCLRSVAEFSEVASPGIAALLATMGMSGVAALVSPAAALVGGIAEDVFLSYGLSLCRIALCSAIAGNLSEAVNLNRFTMLMKKAVNWGSGLAITLFTGLIALQGSVAEAADSLSIRTAKFAADSAAPVIGSGVTDAWDGFVSGVMVTKNALGVSGIAAVLAAGLKPVICCAATMLCLNVIAALLEVFGERETARAAEQISGICQMALSLATGALVIATVLLGAAMAAGRSFFA